MTEQTVPVEVKVTNFPTPDRNRGSAFKTYIIDPNGVSGPKFQQICDYNPKRCRLVIVSAEANICLTLEVPTLSPDPTTSTLAPQGDFLPKSTVDREFFGPDAMWINSIQGETVGRVTVTMEYL